jgi:hypothetical protein
MCMLEPGVKEESVTNPNNSRGGKAKEEARGMEQERAEGNKTERQPEETAQAGASGVGACGGGEETAAL